MSILWIYDKKIEPLAGGTERETKLTMSLIEAKGYKVAGHLMFQQDQTGKIFESNGEEVKELYKYLKINKIKIVINQIGYSKWLLESFLEAGGKDWNKEGGIILTKLHFDPEMFTTTLSQLIQGWNEKNKYQKLKRIGRIILLPYEKYKIKKKLAKEYNYLIENSNNYIILTEKYRSKLIEISKTEFQDRIVSIGNSNTYSKSIEIEKIKLKKKIILIVSRLDEPQKRISLLLKTWEKLNNTGSYYDWELKIVGDGEYRKYYQNIVKIKYLPNVTFVGHADPEYYYREASIYIHAATSEGWGLTITEAMQNGVVPVVMNSSNVFSDIIEHNYNGYLSKNNSVNELVWYVKKLIDNKINREIFAIRATKITEKNDSDVIANKWINLIKVNENGK